MSLLPTFRYTQAIVCRIPDTLTSAIANGHGSGGSNNGTPTKSKMKFKTGRENNSSETNGTAKDVDLGKCRAELENLVTVLREIGLDVIELPPDNACPMSSFVGDVGFVLNGMGVVTRPKSNFRQGDVNTIRTVLKKELDIPVIEVDEEGAHVEGADILFTGRELFVGISNYTNEAGARFLANTFPEYPCSPIKVPGPHHLTHYVNMASPDIICVGHGQDSQDVLKRMEREAGFRYQTITMPEDDASTVLFANGTLIHLSAHVIPQSFKILSEKLALVPRRTVELSELSKLHGSFNRLVVLLAKPKPAKKLTIIN